MEKVILFLFSKIFSFTFRLAVYIWEKIELICGPENGISEEYKNYVQMFKNIKKG